MRTALAALAFSVLALLARGALASGLPPGVTDPAQVKAGIYQLDPAHGKITWSVDHLGFSTYTGQFSHVTATLSLKPGDPPQSRLTASVDMNSIGTLNPALDKVLKSATFFDVAKYPTATFVSTRILRTGKTTANVDGKLTLHGVTRPVILKIRFNRAGIMPIEKTYVAGFDGTATINRSDFGINAYGGFLGDAIPLQLEGEFRLEK